MDRYETAEAVIDRMAEREQPGLTEQDIEGEREDHVDADEAHRRQRKPRAKDKRRQSEHGRGREPRRKKMNGPGHDFRVPIKPVGRKMSTRMRNA